MVLFIQLLLASLAKLEDLIMLSYQCSNYSLMKKNHLKPKTHRCIYIWFILPIGMLDFRTIPHHTCIKPQTKNLLDHNIELLSNLQS
jgi:hypothetical protein